MHAHLSYLEDSSNALELDQVREPHRQWLLNGEKDFSKGYTNSDWWFKLTIKNPANEPRERMLELGYAILDYVDIYVIAEDGLVSTYQTGDRRPYNTRPVDDENFVLPLKWKAGETLTVYYRIQTGSSLQVPMTLWETDAFSFHENKFSMAHGFYYGAMVIIAAYNLLIYPLLRDRSYLYYVGFVLSTPLFFLSISGQGYRYLWPDQIVWNSISIPFSLASLVFFGALFTRSFNRLKSVSVPLDRLIGSFAVAGAIMFLMAVTLPYKTAILFMIPIAALACLSDLVAGSIAWHRGVKSARFYVIAWSCFLVATIIMSLQKLNLFPKSFVVEYAVQLGSLLEAVLLSFALAERINFERVLRSEAQEETVETTRRLNRELELRVVERTEELEKANQRLEVLSNTDQLTQLYNRRYFEEAFCREWERCKRYKHPFSVLLLDVDHFKQVNDQFGHKAGDACLIQIADMLQHFLRTPSDLVARLGGEEFCILLPETDAEEACNVADRIRAAIEQRVMRVNEHRFSVTISGGIYAQIPDDGCNVDEMLNYADKALYLSKSRGRNCVTLYKSGDWNTHTNQRTDQEKREKRERRD